MFTSSVRIVQSLVENVRQVIRKTFFYLIKNPEDLFLSDQKYIVPDQETETPPEKF